MTFEKNFFISFRVSINGNVSGLSTSEGSGIFVLCPFGIFIQVLQSNEKNELLLPTATKI